VFLIADWGLPQHNILLTGPSGEGPIGSEAYIAAKYAITGLASSLELQGGVLTSAIYPGVVASWAGEGGDGEPAFLTLDSSHDEITAAGYDVPEDAIPLSDISASVAFVLSTKATVRTLVLKPRRTTYVGL
jgi:NAD(P)-dependent dehydrogenase (short-subunit alcohol dehydrogenase family)